MMNNGTLHHSMTVAVTVMRSSRPCAPHTTHCKKTIARIVKDEELMKLVLEEFGELDTPQNSDNDGEDEDDI